MDHLSNTAYLKSTECKLAEDFLQAFKQMDIDMLDEAQRSHHLIHLDRDVQNLARNLSLMANHNAPDPIDMGSATAKKKSEPAVKGKPKTTTTYIQFDGKTAREIPPPGTAAATSAAVAAPAPVEEIVSLEEDLEDLVVSGKENESEPQEDDDEIDLC